MYYLINTINLICIIIKAIILIRVLISWLAPYSHNDFTDTVYAVSEPMLRPFRNIFPLGRIDVSPILAFIVIDIIRRILFYFIRF